MSIVPFPQHKVAKPLPRDEWPEHGAAILFFTGIRYEKWGDQPGLRDAGKKTGAGRTRGGKRTRRRA